MNKATNVLFDFSDFTSFSKLHTQTKTNNCKIKKAFGSKMMILLFLLLKQTDF